MANRNGWYHLGRTNMGMPQPCAYTLTRAYPSACPYCGDPGCGDPSGYTYPVWVRTWVGHALFGACTRMGLPRLGAWLWGALTP